MYFYYYVQKLIQLMNVKDRGQRTFVSAGIITISTGLRHNDRDIEYGTRMY